MPTDAAAMVDDYRLLAHDLARARRLLPAARAREFLEAAYAQAHATLHKPATHPGYALWSLFRDQIPEAVRWLRPHIIWVTLLFIVLAVLAGGWLVHTYPDLIALFASPDLIATVERGELWTEGLLNVVPSSVLSLQILTNNIVVSLFAYLRGVPVRARHVLHPRAQRPDARRDLRVHRASTGSTTSCSGSSSRTAASSCR